MKFLSAADVEGIATKNISCTLIEKFLPADCYFSDA